MSQQLPWPIDPDRAPDERPGGQSWPEKQRGPITFRRGQVQTSTTDQRLLDWLRESALGRDHISRVDLDLLTVADDVDDVVRIVVEHDKSPHEIARSAHDSAGTPTAARSARATRPPGKDGWPAGA